MSNSLPIWLEKTERRELPPARKRWRRTDYLEKTLLDIQEVMAEDMYQAGVASGQGVLQRLEPRVKLLGVAVLLLAVALTRSFEALLGIHLVLMALATSSGIGLVAYCKRVWLPSLMFAGVAMLPGTISWVTPGQPIFVIYQGLDWHIGSFVFPTALTITKQGIGAACFVLLRASASLGLVTLMVKTTRWAILTKALGSLGLPTAFVMVLDLTYRYLFLFLLLLTDYLLGRKSRLVAVERHQSMLLWIGGALAGFFRMVGDYSQEIASAMQARGYTGENHQILTTRVGKIDICFLGIVIVICVCIWGGPQFVRTFGI